MQIQSVTSPAFARYGYLVEGHDFAPLLEALNSTPKPDSIVYVPSEPALETLPVAAAVRDNLYGGMPVQIGYCNGSGRTLNCLEYHRGCEINVAADDVILLLAPLQAVREHTLDTSLVEAFLVPAGSAALLYETTLHYAPCNGPGCDGFRVAVILPRDTNTEKPEITVKTGEDQLLWARNKWLLAHSDAPEAALGAHVGLTGANITL